MLRRPRPQPGREWNGAVKRLVGLAFFAQLPESHRQVEPAKGDSDTVVRLGGNGPIEYFNGLRELSIAAVRGPERAKEIGAVAESLGFALDQGNGLLREHDGACRVA